MAEKKGAYKYVPQYHLKLGLILAREGMTIEEIAYFFKVDDRTIYRWKKKFPEFREVLEKGRDEFDLLVTDALFKNCFDRTVIEEDIEITKDENDEEKLRKKIVHKKIIASSVKAQTYWLNNRRPDRWKDKQEVKQEVSGDITYKIELPEDLSKGEDNG